MRSYHALSLFLLLIVPVSSLSSGDPDPLSMAQDAMQQTDFSAAIGWYDQVLSTEPGNESAIIGRFAALSRLSRWDEILQGIATYGSGYIDRPEVAAFNAEAYALTGKPEEALAVLNSCRVIPSEDQVRIRAEILIDQEKDSEALSLVQGTVNSGERDPRLLLLLGTLLNRKGEEEALSYLEEAYIRLPHEPAPAIALGYALASQERYEEALTFLTQACGLIPEDPDVWITKAYYLNRLGRYEEAIAAVKQAEILNPADRDIINAHAYTLCLANRTGEARGVAQEALSYNPSDPSAMDTMGCVLLAEGDTREALKYLEPAADQLFEDPEVLTHLADAYFRLGRDEEAKVLYEQALKLDSGLGRAWRGYSNLLLITGKYPEAASTIAETFRHYPQDSELIAWEQGVDGLLKKWYLNQDTNPQ